jgi:hypothetical protein
MFHQTVGIYYLQVHSALQPTRPTSTYPVLSICFCGRDMSLASMLRVAVKRGPQCWSLRSLLLFPNFEILLWPNSHLGRNSQD